MGSVKWNDKALKVAVGRVAKPLVDAETRQKVAQANSMGGHFRTGTYHRPGEAHAVGNTKARYAGDVQMEDGIWPVGIVHTDNYAACRDTIENLTLLKVL